MGRPLTGFLTHMSRIKLLQSSEVKVFDAPPVFTYEHRIQFFNTDEPIQTELGKLRTPYSKLGFLIQLGYFKWTGRFFEVGHFRGKDIEHLIKKLEFPINSFDFQSQYSKQLAYYHREQILELCQWKPFDETICRNQIKRLVERQLMPRKVLFEIQAYLFRARMEAPAYDKYLRIINEIMLEVGKDISRALQDQLNDGHRKILDEFLS
jgi:hypothetical protein